MGDRVPEAVTQPKLARSRSGREYVWPPDPPHELAVPSVTTIIGGGVPKDALKFWAAKMAATYAVEHREAWKDLPPEDAIDLIKRASTRFTESAANRGDAVHNGIEAYLGHEVTRPMNELERAYAAGAYRFLRDYEVEVERVELTVFSRTHGYAGTADLLMRTASLPGPVIADWKTSKSVYDETALQLCAGARADFIAEADGVTETPLPEGIEWGITVRLTPDGDYEAVPFRLTDEVFAIFLAAKVVAAREPVLRGVRELALSKPTKESVE